MRIESKGLDETIDRMRARVERLTDLRDAMESWGEGIVTATDTNYQMSRNFDGTPFAPLRPSTVNARLAKVKGGNRKSKKTGKLTKAARALRKTAREAYRGGNSSLIKILVDTAAMRNSNHVQDATPDSIKWSSLGYLGYHMAGTKRMKARNPTAFVWKSGEWVLHEKANKGLRDALLSYIQTGEL